MMQRFVVDSSWTDKDSKIEKFRELYEQDDFLTAYSKHTDLRVETDPHQAIGGEWETHGILQRDFLIAQGLMPEHRLLDLGCGTGRLARTIVPYLNEGNYTGVDISANALAYASQLAVDEGWISRLPNFVQIPTADGTLSVLKGHEPFDLLWSHSVLTHLPAASIDALFGSLDHVMAQGSRYFFTYKLGKHSERTGLKQFRYSPEFLAGIADAHGFKFQTHPKMWPASQRTAFITRS